MVDSSTVDEDNLNFESLDDLESEIESYTGYGNEPEYTEQEIANLGGFSEDIDSGSEDDSCLVIMFTILF